MWTEGPAKLHGRARCHSRLKSERNGKTVHCTLRTKSRRKVTPDQVQRVLNKIVMEFNVLKQREGFERCSYKGLLVDCEHSTVY